MKHALVKTAVLAIAIGAVGFSSLGTGNAAANMPAHSICDTAAYHALDFTIGTWSVTVAGFPGKSASEIRRDIRGCSIVERFAGGGDVGMNIDAYNAEDAHWHRFFVDSRGRVHTFDGVVRGNTLEYRGTSREPDGRTIRNRLELRDDGPLKMTQLWQKSSDGKAWSTAFEGIYERSGRR